MTWLWWAPLCAASLHIFEEFVFPGGFAEWDRSYRPQIKSSITPRLHVFINALLLLACLQVGLLASANAGRPAAVRSALPPAYAVAAWLTLAALLASNAVFHLLGAVKTRRYSPGLGTGLVFYVPMAVFGYWYFLTHARASAGTAVAAALVGGSYHFWMAIIHGRRSRRLEQ